MLQKIVSKLKKISAPFQFMTKEPWRFLALNVICGGIFFCGKVPFLSKGLKIPENHSFDQGVASIILGCVATLIGVLVPLHYSMVLQILNNLKNINKMNNHTKDIDWLKRYIQTSDILICVTGFFGGSTLLVGVCAMASSLKILNFYSYSPWIGRAFLFLMALSIFKSVTTSGKQLCLQSVSCIDDTWPGRCYEITIILIIFLSCGWARILGSIDDPNLIAISSLFILSIFYILWLLLKIPFVPLGRLASILNNEPSLKILIVRR